MKNRRLALFSFLISLPAVLILTIGFWLIVENVPRSIRREPHRIQVEYREQAEDLVAHPEAATYHGERKNGWRQRPSRIDGKVWGLSEQENDSGKVWLWFRDESGMHLAREIDVFRPFPYALVFYWGGGLVGLVLIFLSALAVVNLIRFLRERDDFLAATAHDLTTPLVGMRRMIGRNDEEAKRLNERMILLVDNIKNFLKLGGRRKEPDLKSVDIVALAREAYALFAADYEDSECGPVEFVVSVGQGQRSEVKGQTMESLPPVFVDETMTLQIFWNLFGNDLKYAAPHGKVEVRLSADGKNVTVEFADEGPGMTPRQMRKAFDRYYRAKTVLQTGKGGFGIGLCTAREFARAMGGDLTVRANVPRGCVFSLRLQRFGEHTRGIVV